LNRTPRKASRRIGFPLSCALLIVCGTAAASDGAGIVVRNAPPPIAGETCGLEKGDLLTHCAAGARAGVRWGESTRLSSYCEAEAFLGRTLPLEGGVLRIRRGEAVLDIALPPQPWDIRVRPDLDHWETDAAHAAMRLLREGDAAGGERVLVEAADAADRSGRIEQAWYMLWRFGRSLCKRRRYDRGVALFEKGIDLAAQSGAPCLQATLHREIGKARMLDGRFADAAKAYERALAILGTSNPSSFPEADAMSGLGETSRRTGDMEGALRAFEAALVIRERLAPDSLAVARSLTQIGDIHWRTGNLDLAESCHERSLAMKERVVPASRHVAMSLNNLGIISYERGDLDLAEERYRRSLAIKEKLPGSRGALAAGYNNLAVLLKERGRYADAEAMLLKALEIRKGQDPDSLETSHNYANLGYIAYLRGHLSRAEHFFSESLRLRQALAPRSPETASALANLAMVLGEAGGFEDAKRLYEHADALYAASTPDGLPRIHLLYSLGLLEQRAGRPESARKLLTHALTLCREVVPDSKIAALCMRGLASAAGSLGAPEDAESYYWDALEILSGVCPDSPDEASLLHEFGLFRCAAGRWEEGGDLLLRAVEVLERHRIQVGGSDRGRSSYSSKYMVLYRDAIDVLVREGKAGKALEVLERSRARAFLSLLAERDISLEEVPGDLILSVREADRAYEKAKETLAGLSLASDAERVKELRRDLRSLRARQEDLREEIRQRSPRIGALRYPQPLGFKGIRGALPEKTLLLAYSVGGERSILFAVGSESRPVQTFVIPWGEERMALEVRRFRRFIRDRGDVSELSERLGDALLRGAREAFCEAERILVIPDGPLHLLPFGALRVPSSTASDAPYWSEFKPYSKIASVTVYAEIARSQRPVGGRVAAFGDPHAPPETRPASLPDDLRLDSLPAARIEAAAAASVAPGNAAMHFGADATEEAVKGLSGDFEIIHLACHGILDERFPLDSCLVLAREPGNAEPSENGLLTVWEIFETLRFRSDLVTLSACGTARGETMGGEGLLGMTRAFLFAGSRSVVSSLWAVEDESTALLMRKFYESLGEGETKAQALCDAQRDLLATGRGGCGEDRSHPFFWAAFELYGE